MPSSPTYDADDDADAAVGEDIPMVPNRKLEAIQAVMEYVQGSRLRLDSWEPTPTTDTTPQYSDTFDAGQERVPEGSALARWPNT